MTQMNIDPNVQKIVTGGLLLVSVVIPNVGRIGRTRLLRRLRTCAAQHRDLETQVIQRLIPQLSTQRVLSATVPPATRR